MFLKKKKKKELLFYLLLFVKKYVCQEAKKNKQYLSTYGF